MNSGDSQFELLLPSADPVTVDLAQDLLESEGIPSYLHNPDFDVVELGSAHRALRGSDLFVPAGSRELARSILVTAWGEEAVAAHERGDRVPPESNSA